VGDAASTDFGGGMSDKVRIPSRLTMAEAKGQTRLLDEWEIELEVSIIMLQLPLLPANQTAVLKRLRERTRERKNGGSKWSEFPWTVDATTSAYAIRGKNKDDVLEKTFEKMKESEEWCWLERYNFDTLKARYGDGDENYRTVKQRNPEFIEKMHAGYFGAYKNCAVKGKNR
jgi:hypothetical protein